VTTALTTPDFSSTSRSLPALSRAACTAAEEAVGMREVEVGLRREEGTLEEERREEGTLGEDRKVVDEGEREEEEGEEEGEEEAEEETLGDGRSEEGVARDEDETDS
jgi:hypothetical protein